MKTAIAAIVLALLSAGGASAQTHPKPSPQQHASVADQQACYQQARGVVDRIQSDDREYAKTHDSLIISNGIANFDGAHYDAASKTCYVQWSRFSVFGSMDVAVTNLNVIAVEDAFEGKSIATFVENSTIKHGDAAFIDQPPIACQVNGTKCARRAEFNGLLWDFLPAFRPVDAVTVK